MAKSIEPYEGESAENFRHRLEREHQERYLNYGDALVTPTIDRICESSYKWPTFLRRLYLVTFPLAFTIRILAVVVLTVVGGILNMVGFFANRSAHMWAGTKPRDY